MHQYIYQVFERPCSQEDWMSEEIFWEHPDVLPVANTTAPVENRAAAITHLGAWLERGQLGTLCGETFSLNPQAAHRYFEGRFPAFQQAMSALRQVSEEQFIQEYNQVQNLIDDLSKAFTNRYDVYVMMGSDFPPLPMDAFLRIAQPDTPYYIGTVLDFSY